MEALGLVWSGPSALTLSVSNWINCCVTLKARVARELEPTEVAHTLFPLFPPVPFKFRFQVHSLWSRFFGRRWRVRLFLRKQLPERPERVERKGERLGNVERFLLRLLQRAGDFVFEQLRQRR